MRPQGGVLVQRGAARGRACEHCDIDHVALVQRDGTNRAVCARGVAFGDH